MKIITLGPAGSFSHIAARQWLRSEGGDEEDIIFLDDIDELFCMVEEGAGNGVVPVENSIEGSVGETLDALLTHDVYVVGEIIIKIHHHLLSMASSLEEIDTVVSHPQALRQCRKSLSQLKKKIITTYSTSQAAKLAAENKGYAALASEEAARYYGLNILLRNLEDASENYTRFAVLGKSLPPPSGDDKTSIAIYLKNDRPGALYDILREFADRHINLTRIESRSRKRGLGDYMFFIDFEGYIGDVVVQEIIEGCRKLTDEIKILGTYQAAH